MINTYTTLREFGRCRLDVEKKLLWAADEPVPLPLKAVELLCLLVENRGAVVTKDEIWRAVWNDAFVEETNLTHNIYLLRRAFKDLGEDHLIKTIPRRGYRFTGEVREIPTSDVILERHARTTTTIEFQETTAKNDASGVEASSAKATRLSRSSVVLLSVTIPVLTFFGFWMYVAGSTTADTPVHSLAILPFNRLNAAKPNDHLGVGMADALITRMGRIKSLVVRPTSSIISFEGSNADSLSIARRLKVDAVMEGTLFESGGKRRATLRLLRVADGRTIWSGEFEDTTGDDLAFERAISVKAADALAVDIGSEEQLANSRMYSSDPDAYRLYLKGRYEWNKRSWDGMANAEKDFRAAIEKDPNFALAYVGLADRLAMTSEASEAYAMVEHALELDPDLAEAKATAGFIETFHRWNWAEAENDFQRSIALNPNYATAHQWYGNFLAIRGRTDEAIIEMQKAIDIDPTSPNFLADLGQTYYFRRDYETARAYCQKALEIDPEFHFAHDYLFNIALMTGDLDSAVDEWKLTAIGAESFPNLSDQQRGDMTKSYERLSLAFRTGTMEDFVRSLIVKGKVQGTTGYHNARFYSLLGDEMRAIDELEAGIDARTFGVVFAMADPFFDGIRNKGRYQAILKKMDLQDRPL
jgi:DNA-binding winged helix-turn-helix (wHTH) protein/tetratricopeptide (TPR) repeat protein